MAVHLVLCAADIKVVLPVPLSLSAAEQDAATGSLETSRVAVGVVADFGENRGLIEEDLLFSGVSEDVPGDVLVPDGHTESFVDGGSFLVARVVLEAKE